MVTSTVVLHGQVIIEGVKFLWWVIDGQPARLTVSHALYGTETRPADKEPERQARSIARKLLAGVAIAEPAPRRLSNHKNLTRRLGPLHWRVIRRSVPLRVTSQ